MLKSHGDAVLPDYKRYFNYGNSRARLVIEGALGKLKTSLEFFLVNVKVIRKLSTYMVWPALYFITFALNAIIYFSESLI